VKGCDERKVGRGEVIRAGSVEGRGVRERGKRKIGSVEVRGERKGNAA
jgi:hypothetical protein